MSEFTTTQMPESVLTTIPPIPEFDWEAWEEWVEEMESLRLCLPICSTERYLTIYGV